MADKPLVVGSWPGPDFGTNAFVGEYARALTAAGCRVVDVYSPIRIDEPIDVLHIHWPEQLFWQGGSTARQALRVARALAAIAQLRARGIRVVWMVHNLRPHELRGARRPLWRVIERALPRLVDGVMTLSPSTVPVVAATFPALADKPATAVPHPAYPNDAPSRGDARRALRVPGEAQVFAMLGFLRPYKGIEELIRSFRALPGPHRRLIVAGQCAPAYATALHALAEGDGRITLITDRLDQEQLASYTAAADWIVLPFRDYLHSGSMIHALSLQRPVLTLRAPFAADLVAGIARDAVVMYDGALSADILAALPLEPPRADLSSLDPATIGQAARAFYETLGERR